MTAGSAPAPGPQYNVSPGLWVLAWRRLKQDAVGMVSMVIVALFVVMMVLSGVGLLAKNWADEVAVNYAPPTFVGPEAKEAAGKAEAGAGTASVGTGYKSPVADPLAKEMSELGASAESAAGSDTDDIVDPIGDVMAEILGKHSGAQATAERHETLVMGADRWGRDVVAKVIKGSETSIFVGLAAALVATVLGTLFGALAGFYGKWVDDAFNWFYSVFTAVPYLLLILAIAAVLNQKGMLTIILILGFTGWTGIFRLVRAEYMKHNSREYVQAADAIGASNGRRMFVHILPNVSHVVLVQLSLHVVQFIKAEVILSFLGFGVPVDVVSWGSMLNEAQNELILGKWWQLVVAGTTMAVLVTAFSMFTDALRDALDPKLK